MLLKVTWNKTNNADQSNIWFFRCNTLSPALISWSQSPLL